MTRRPLALTPRRNSRRLWLLLSLVGLLAPHGAALQDEATAIAPEPATVTEAIQEAPPEAPQDDVPEGVQPTLEQIFRPPRLLGQRPSDVAVSADGRWASWRWTPDDDTEPELDLWLARTDGSVAPRVLCSHDDEVSVRWTRRGAQLLVERAGWLELLDVDSDEPAVPLFEGGGLSGAQLLDDGRHMVLSTGKHNQLWVLDLETGARWTPAAELEQRTSWFAVAEDSGQVALFAAAKTDEPPKGDKGDKPITSGKPAMETKDTKAGKPKAPKDAAPDDEPERVLWLVSLDGSGQPETRDARPGGRTEVSPDGRWVASSRTEDAIERSLIMADYLTDAVTAVPVRTSLAGDPAGAVALIVHGPDGVQPFVPPIDAEDRYYLRSLGWSPDSEHLLVERLSQDFHVRQLLVVDPERRTSWPVHVERDDAWIGGPTQWADWSRDGSEVLFTSERSGFNHLYAVPASGGSPRALTAGDFEVQAVALVDGTDRALLSANALHDPAVRQLIVLDLVSGESQRITPDDGCVSWSRRDAETAASRDGSTIVYRFERLGVPGDLYAVALTPPEPLAAGRGTPPTGGGTAPGAGLGVRGEPVRLTDTVTEAFLEQAFVPPEIVAYENAADGRSVAAFLYRPQPFDPEQSYPAVVFIHGAGYLQNVLKSMSAYDVNMLFHQRLARKGYVVLDPDYRHSAGYGRDFRAEVHGHMGGKDLDDVVAGVDYLASLGFVDTDRVGVYGGSYGGFLTLMALFTKPDVFAAGAALRSVTDWRTYNHWYTNPRLGTPKDDPEAYAASSPIDHVAGLTRPLLLLHGLKDDNVFAQDTIRLVEKLIELGKDFDAMLYPSQAHGFTAPASWIDEYGRIERFFDRHVMGDG